MNLRTSPRAVLLDQELIGWLSIFTTSSFSMMIPNTGGDMIHPKGRGAVRSVAPVFILVYVDSSHRI